MAAHLAVDGDVVVVVDGHQLTQAHGTGQRTGLVGDAFHETAVAEEDISEVVDDVVTGLVELPGQHLLRDRHTDGVGDALPEGTRRGLDAGGITVLGVARGLGMELAELHEVLDAQRVAREVQQRVEQHGPMAVGEHEAVAVGPLGVRRIVPHEVVPQDLGDVRHAHGCAGMARVGLLDRIHAQSADGVGEFSA